MPPREGSISSSSRFRRSTSGSPVSDSESSSRRSKTTRTSVPEPSWRSENLEAQCCRAHRSPRRARRRRSGFRARSPGGRTEAFGEIVSVPARQRRLASRDRHERPEAVPLGLIHPTLSTRQALRRRREHRRVPARRPRRAVLSQEEPVPRVAVEPGRYERPDAFESLSVEPDGQPTVSLSSSNS